MGVRRNFKYVNKPNSEIYKKKPIKMKNNLFKGLLLFTVIFLSSELFGQFTLSGEFRPRAEFRHGYKTLSASDAEAAFFTSQRTRLNLYYTTDNFKVGFS